MAGMDADDLRVIVATAIAVSLAGVYRWLVWKLLVLIWLIPRTIGTAARRYWQKRTVDKIGDGL